GSSATRSSGSPPRSTRSARERADRRSRLRPVASHRARPACHPDMTVTGRRTGMRQDDWLAERFEEHRARLRALAYRMLGSLAEADDALQDAWLRVSRAGAQDVDNIGGWLTTVVARVCLNMLRARANRREDALDVRVP